MVFDRAIIVSADSDLSPPVKLLRERFPNKQVLVAAPPGRFSNARDLQPGLEITKGRVAKHLLPATLDNGAIIRPVEYDPPAT